MGLHGLAAALLLAAAPAVPEVAGCPGTIAVKQSLDGPVPGWSEGRVAEPHRLAGITIFDGKPEQLAALQGEDRVLSKTKTATSWKFAENREYWMRCSYAGTVVTLDRLLPRTTSRCTITFSRHVRVGGLPEIQQVDCRGK